jgi:hypothetical protein
MWKSIEGGHHVRGQLVIPGDAFLAQQTLQNGVNMMETTLNRGSVAREQINAPLLSK